MVSGSRQENVWSSQHGIIVFDETCWLLCCSSIDTACMGPTKMNAALFLFLLCIRTVRVATRGKMRSIYQFGPRPSLNLTKISSWMRFFMPAVAFVQQGIVACTRYAGMNWWVTFCSAGLSDISTKLILAGALSRADHQHDLNAGICMEG
jgi:hypothetical protein